MYLLTFSYADKALCSILPCVGHLHSGPYHGRKTCNLSVAYEGCTHQSFPSVDELCDRRVRLYRLVMLDLYRARNALPTPQNFGAVLPASATRSLRSRSCMRRRTVLRLRLPTRAHIQHGIRLQLIILSGERTALSASMCTCGGRRCHTCLSHMQIQHWFSCLSTTAGF